MEIAKLISEYLKVLIWPLTTIILFLIYRGQIIALFGRIKKADLPGGISLETYPEYIKAAKVLSKEVVSENRTSNERKKTPNIPLTEANARMLNLALSPSPTGLNFNYYRTLSDQDPNLALAGLRIEFETMLKNLAKGFNVDIAERDSATLIAQKLQKKNAITTRQAELIYTVIQLCNAAVHGIKVTSNQAKEILKISEMLRNDYISWLSWGFSSK